MLCYARTTPCHAMPCHVMLCRAELWFGIRIMFSCDFMVFRAIPFRAMLLSYALLCCVMPCYAYLSGRKRHQFFSESEKYQSRTNAIKLSNLELGRYIYLNDNPNIFPRNLIECGFRAFSNIGSSRCTAMAYYTLEKESIYCLMTRD